MNIQIIEISKLKRAEYNPRKKLRPEDEEYKKLEKSINEFGHVLPIVVNYDMTVIGGQQNLTILENKGHKKVACNVVNLNKTQEKALNLALNKISGEWDNDKLQELLAELKEAEFDMDITGFSPEELNDIFNDALEATEDGFDIDKALEEIEEPVSKPGVIWMLGRHRLMCGDSTQKEDVMRLMNKQNADMILTDPPYNVNYEGTAGKIKNDNMDQTKFYNFLLDSFRNMYEVAKAGAPIYVFHADTEGLNFRNAFKSVGFKLTQCLVWVKNTFVMGRQDYQWQHEPCLYRMERGSSTLFY